MLILRHAKSSWKQPELADHDRPLNARGKRDAPRMGRLVRDEGLTPDLIVTSTAKRARKTATKVARACGCEREVSAREELFHAEPGAFLEVVRGLPEKCDRVMVVGHNPGLEDLLSALTGADEPLPTAALAQVEIDVAEWQHAHLDQSARCVHVWLPRDLG